MSLEQILATANKYALPTIGGALGGAAITGGIGELSNNDPDIAVRRKKRMNNLLMGAGLGGTLGAGIFSQMPEMAKHENAQSTAQQWYGAGRHVVTNPYIGAAGVGAFPVIRDRNINNGFTKDQHLNSVNGIFEGKSKVNLLNGDEGDAMYNPKAGDAYREHVTDKLFRRGDGRLTEHGFSTLVNDLHRDDGAHGREIAKRMAEGDVIPNKASLAYRELLSRHGAEANQARGAVQDAALGSHANYRPNSRTWLDLPSRIIDSFSKNNRTPESMPGHFGSRLWEALRNKPVSQGPTLAESIGRETPLIPRSMSLGPKARMVGGGLLGASISQGLDRYVFPTVDPTAFGEGYNKSLQDAIAAKAHAVATQAAGK